MNTLTLAALAISFFCAQTKTTASDAHSAQVKYQNRLMTMARFGANSLCTQPKTAASDLNDELFKAIEKSNVEKAQTLLAAGADTNARFYAGHASPSPLSHAANFNCPEMIQLLLEKGAKANYCHPACGTALHHLFRQPAQSHTPTICRMLLNAGVDINAFDLTAPVLHLLASVDIDDRPIIPLMLQVLEAGANKELESTGPIPKTAIFWAGRKPLRRKIIEAYPGSTEEEHLEFSITWKEGVADPEVQASLAEDRRKYAALIEARART